MIVWSKHFVLLYEFVIQTRKNYIWLANTKTNTTYMQFTLCKEVNEQFIMFLKIMSFFFFSAFAHITFRLHKIFLLYS